MSHPITSIEMIRRLVAMDTTSRNSNLGLIGFIAEYLAAHGVESRLVHDESGHKANLYATLGPADKPGIALSGHTDVVPVDGQDWASDPWTLAEREGRLFGRGTADMKSFIAVALAMVPEILRRRPATPIHLVFSYDEEVGCVGVRRLLEILRDQPVKPFACIIGEPTEMKVMVGHKGKMSLRCRVHGRECHSSLAPQGVNAVEYAATLISHMRGMAQRLALDGPFDNNFDVAHTTVHTGVVHGGTALNIVPKDCAFDFEFRYVPGVAPETLLAAVKSFAEDRLLPEMRRVAPEAGFSWEPLSAFPGLDTPVDSEIVAFVKSLTGANSVGKVAFGTEGGLFHEAGIPTVICGPGSIAQAHKPDEFIELEQVALCEAFMRRLMDRLCVQ
ncbi:MAG: acetylornithine deacetylase [Rhodospirillaceae bacterium]|nr:acetylornithine deacetylase [Rhodospirillaceae bacterium]